MEDVTFVQMIGAWTSIFLTLAVLSFLYEDNPVYKLAEHLFMGVSIGIGVTEQWFGVFKPNLADKLVRWSTDEVPAGYLDAGSVMVRPWSFIPLALLAMLFFKLSRKYSWVARIPIAFLVAAYAGVKITGQANSNLMTQVAKSMPNLAETWAAHGFWNSAADGQGLFSDLFLVAGLTACLVHFYFSRVPTEITKRGIRGAQIAFGAVFVVGTMGVLVQGGLPFFATVFVGLALGATAAIPFLAFSEYRDYVTRFGVLTLMLSFGASFGYTVMGRISLAIGRAYELFGLLNTAEENAAIQPKVATVVIAVAIIAYLVRWKRSGGIA